MNGVEYALSGAEGAEKKAFVEQYVNEAFKEEFEKVAGPRLDLLKETVKGVGNMIGRDAPAVGARLKEGVSLKNAREYVMARTAAAGKVKNPVAGFEGEGEKMNEYANSIKPKAMKDLGIAGGAIGGAALIGMGIKRALKNPGMAEKAMAFMKANKGKIAIGAGAGAAGAIGANAVFGKKDTTVNNY